MTGFKLSPMAIWSCKHTKNWIISINIYLQNSRSKRVFLDTTCTPFSQKSHLVFCPCLDPYSWWSRAIGPAVQRFNRLQQKLWQKVVPRPGMKLSLSTLAKAQTTHRKTVSPHKMWRQIHSFCLPYNSNSSSTMTLFYLMTLSQSVSLFACENILIIWPHEQGDGE